MVIGVKMLETLEATYAFQKKENAKNPKIYEDKNILDFYY